MIRKITLTLFIIFLSNQAVAKELTYQGKVEGMVCAFCVYNVSKAIGKLKGVEAQSVNVDLKSGVLSFRSNLPVDDKKLATMVADAGFKLTDLKVVNKSTLELNVYKTTPLMTLNLNSIEVKKYEPVFEAIGDVAAAQLGKLVIKAPASVEIEILKPMIASRQKVARVQYIFDKGKSIQIKLFPRAE